MVIRKLFFLLVTLPVVVNAFTRVAPAVSRPTILSDIIAHHGRSGTIHHDGLVAPRRGANPVPLQMAQQGNDNTNKADPTGLKRGAYLMTVVLALCVWIFSVPTEFRRNRFCSAEQVELYPNRKCMTATQWVSGLSQYYANGGGVHFDFSIEEEE